MNWMMRMGFEIEDSKEDSRFKIMDSRFSPIPNENLKKKA